MTSREKAEELVDKFAYFDIYVESIRMPYEEAVKCALICVEEIIDQWEYIDTYLADLGGKLNLNLKYWYEVKKELLNM